MAHNIERFYKSKSASIRYIKNHCGEKLLTEVEDIYHESLIIAHRRKNDDPTRTDGLCLFSGYGLALRAGPYFNWVYRKDLVNIDNVSEDKLNPSYFLTENPVEESTKMCDLTQLAHSISLGLVFLVGHSALHTAINVYILTIFGDYKTLSDLGRETDLSRERIRQLRNLGLETIKLLVEDMMSTMSTNFIYMDHIKELTGITLRRLWKSIPHHLSFSSLYTQCDRNFAEALCKFVKVVAGVSRDIHSLNKKASQFNYDYDMNFKGIATMESYETMDDIFVSLHPTPITIYYHHRSETIDIGWLRSFLGCFKKTENGWYDTLIEDKDEIVFYSTIEEVIENCVLDPVSENWSDDYEKIKELIDIKLFKFLS